MSQLGARRLALGGGLLWLAIAAPSIAAAQEIEAGGLTVDVGGYGSFRYEASNTHEAEGDELASSFTLRRFVVTTDARYKTRFQVYSEIEYERLSEIEVERGVEAEDGGLAFEQELEGSNGSEIALEQAWGQFNFTEGLGLRFGAILPPVGRFNLRHDDNLWNFARRPLVDRGAKVLPAAAAWTEMGLGLVGEIQAGEVPITWQAYVMNGVQLDFAIEEKIQTRDPRRDKLELEAAVSPTSGAFDGSNDADALAARLAVSPTLGSEIAISGYAGQYTPDWLDEEASITTIAIDGRQRLGPIWLEGEWMRTEFGDLERVLADFASVALEHATETASTETADLESEIEVELSGVSDTRSGFWLDLAWPIALPRGTWGLESATVTPVARIEYVKWDENLKELDFARGRVTALEREDREQSRVTVGLAFRPIEQTVFHLAYERSDSPADGMIEPDLEIGSLNTFVFGMAVGF